MAGKKKTFACGHQGKGQYCHRCEAQRQQQAQKQQQRDDWQQRLAQAPCDLAGLPVDIATRGLDIMAQLDRGADYRQLHGKRLAPMGKREIISIPVGRRYRLLCRERADHSLEYLELISHETYNNRLAALP